MPNVKHYFYPLGSAVMAIALVMLVTLVSGRDTAYATSFNPTISTTLADSEVGQNSDIIGTFGVPQGDSNFGGVVAFTPPQWSVAADADVPNGAIVLELVSQVKLGLFGNTCSTSLTVSFNMMDATTNINNTLSSVADPLPGDSAIQPFLNDADGNGFPDGVDKYPSFLNELFDPDDGGPLGPVQPRARLFGVAEVPTTSIAVILNFVLFEPGALAGFPDAPPEFANVDFGFPSVTVLNDPTGTVTTSAANTVTDFCSSLAVETTTFGITKDNVCSPPPGPAACRTSQGNHLIGFAGSGTNPDEGGAVFRKNPTTAGPYTFRTFAVSLWDADDDGIENPLDPCPLTPDPNWDPRSFFGLQPGGDSDADGLPDSCDPDINNQSPVRSGTAGFNQDLDLFMNAADNCPLVPNDDQADEDSDFIGDVCDPYPNDETNNGAAHQHELFVTAHVTVVEAPNQPPTCAGATVTPLENTTSSSFSLNCSDPDNDPLTCSVVTPGSKGTLNVTSCTSATYTPNANATGADTVTYKANDGTVDSADASVTVTVVAPKKVTAEVAAGETVTTDEEGDGATADSPVEATVTSPIGDTISIETATISVTPPQGFQFLGLQVEISGPAATPNDPLIIVFQLDSSILDGENENTIQIFKDGVQVADCSGASGTASPDPCVSGRALLGDGDVEITVLASTASSWNFGVTEKAVAGETGDPSGTGTGAAGGAATGVGSLAPAISSIPTWAAIASGLGLTGLLGSLGALASRILRRRRQ